MIIRCIAQLLPATALIAAATAADPLDEWLQRSNGIYSLHEAAAAGDTPTLKKRLAQGADPNARDEQGDSPLHLAAATNNAQSVALLLSAGGDPLAQDTAGRCAADRSGDDGVRELCREASKRRQREIEASDDLSNGRVFRMAAALENGVSANAQYKDNSGTFLMQAVRESRPHMVRLLIRHGADVNAVVPGGESILQAAALRKNPWIVQDLLTAGADPMVRNDNLATPLHEAVWAENEQTVRVLLPAYRSCNFSPDGAHNDTPLHLAIVRQNIRIVRLFLEAGINFDHPAYRKTPLIPFATENGTPEIVELLRTSGAE